MEINLSLYSILHISIFDYVRFIVMALKNFVSTFATSKPLESIGTNYK